jgi:NAD(P)-dependent dehydrogenase (short-subunit alcohol dehydrogenase family)
MAGQLEGKVAIVTGASRGIGRAIAVLFAREGARVAVAARTEQERDERLPGTIYDVVREIESFGGKAIAVRTDVSKEEDVRNLVARTREAFGPIDILVNNAAVNWYIPVKDYPLHRWQTLLNVNLTGPFMLIQAVLPDMLERRSGNIINISSRAAIGPGPGPYTSPGRGGTPYGVSKAALERLTQGLAQELFEYNIAVNALSPSQVVPTPGVLFHRLVESPDDPRAEPVEYMARAALVLATQTAQTMTGRITYSQEILREFGLL